MNVVSGDSFPDGESMAAVPGPAGNIATLVTPASGVVGHPVSALCSSADAALQSFSTRALLFGYNPVVRIAGGTAAVSAAVEAEINRDVCPTTLDCTRRYAGSDRYGTSLLIAQNLVTQPYDFTAATGTDWADGVAGGPLAWQAGSPVLLYDNGATTAGADVTSNARFTSSGYVLGGTTAEPRQTMASFAASFPAVPIGGQIISNIDRTVCVDDSGGGTGNGNVIQLWGCNGTASQAWRLYSNGELVVLGGCMTAASTGWWGSKIQYDTCTGSNQQTWGIGPDGNLVNGAFGLCLDDPSSNTNWTTQLQVWGCDQTAAQNWTLP
jgi:Ricin-type beta-trefoil lectin domain/ell wall binding domain 2 (CWB2)